VPDCHGRRRNGHRGTGSIADYQTQADDGDTVQSLHEAARVLIDLGVYPFIVPFVPLSGTPLAEHQPPSAEFLRAVLGPVGQWLSEAGMTSGTAKAGCVKCAACSTLSTFEKQSVCAA
jgi:biotin synthase-related radical SAM superfamily protein